MKNILLCFLTIITLFISACNDGVRIIRPVPKPTELQTKGVNHIKIQGTLKSETGENVGGISITAETQSSSNTDITTWEGKFRIDVLFTPEEEIDFRFSGKGIEWTENLHNIPKGVDVVTVHFVVKKNNTVKLLAVEY